MIKLTRESLIKAIQREQVEICVDLSQEDISDYFVKCFSEKLKEKNDLLLELFTYPIGSDFYFKGNRVSTTNSDVSAIYQAENDGLELNTDSIETCEVEIPDEGDVPDDKPIYSIEYPKILAAVAEMGDGIGLKCMAHPSSLEEVGTDDSDIAAIYKYDYGSYIKEIRALKKGMHVRHESIKNLQDLVEIRDKEIGRLNAKIVDLERQHEHDIRCINNKLKCMAHPSSVEEWGHKLINVADDKNTEIYRLEKIIGYRDKMITDLNRKIQNLIDEGRTCQEDVHAKEDEESEPMEGIPLSLQGAYFRQKLVQREIDIAHLMKELAEKDTQINRADNIVKMLEKSNSERYEEIERLNEVIVDLERQHDADIRKLQEENKELVGMAGNLNNIIVNMQVKIDSLQSCLDRNLRYGVPPMQGKDDE